MAPSRQPSPDPSIASANTKRWRNGIDLETADNDEIEGFIEWRIKVYKREEWRGKDLWEVFEDDFEGFTKETFQGGGKDATRKLRDCLRAKGVYVPKDRKLITANLELVLNEYQEWPADDKEGPIQELITPSPYLPPTLPTFTAPDERERTLRPPSEEGEPSAQPAFARTVPQARDTRRNGYGKELAMLLKMHGEEHKYSGENDNFDYKYQIFLDSCDRAGVPQEALMIAFPTMLKGPALDFFYANKIKGYKRIEQVCESIKNYFEGKEHKRGLLSKWNSLTLKNVIEENQGKGKNTQECLQLLIQELRHLQHGLDKELQNDKFIHNKLIDACQEVPACTYACFKPADNLAGLISDLRSSIITYEKANRSDMSTFFTDRKYRGQDRQRNDLRNPATEFDSNSEDQNRYLDVERPIREDRSQKANPIYSDAAPDYQSHWKYSDSTSKPLGQCLDADSRYQGQRLDDTSRSNFAASNSTSLSTAFNADLVSKILTMDLFNDADNPHGEKTRLEECLLPCNEPFSANIRKLTIIIGFYHKYVRMKYLSQTFPLLFVSFRKLIIIIGFYHKYVRMKYLSQTFSLLFGFFFLRL
jgi:hypothetical protein